MIQKMIIGRIGNQLFQYSTIRSYMIKYGINQELCFNFDLVGSDSNNGYCDSLSLLNTLPYKTTKKIKTTFSQKIIIFFIKAIEKIIDTAKGKSREKRIYNFEKRIQKFINKFGIFWVRYGFIPLGPCKYNKDNLIFHGFFESEKFFKENFDLFKDELKLTTKISQEDKKLAKTLKDNNYTCISIRKGDFITNPVFAKKHYICNPEYFYRAINKHEELVSETNYYICSDDIEWCKKNLKIKAKNIIFEKPTNTLEEKIYLMTNCRNYIMSNSTFSWWTMYLSNSDNKIVIAPKKWRINDYTLDKTLNDIYQNNWVLV